MTHRDIVYKLKPKVIPTPTFVFSDNIFKMKNYKVLEFWNLVTKTKSEN